MRQDAWIPVLQGSEARHIRRQTGAGRWDRGNIASSGRYHQLAAAPRPVVGFDLETSILLPDLRDARSRPDRSAQKVVPGRVGHVEVRRCRVECVVANFHRAVAVGVEGDLEAI